MKDNELQVRKRGELTMKILVLGAGVLGCNLTNDLFCAGKDVTLLARGAWGEEIQKNGLRIKSIFTPWATVSRVPVVTELKPEDSEVQLKVTELQDYISEHFYQCSNEILAGLGKMYASGGEFTENIDKVSGRGTAEFAAKAIEPYCK